MSLGQRVNICADAAGRSPRNGQLVSPGVLSMGGPPLLQAVSAAVTAATSAAVAAIVSVSLGPGVTTATPGDPEVFRTTPGVNKLGKCFLMPTYGVHGPMCWHVACAGCLPGYCLPSAHTHASLSHGAKLTQVQRLDYSNF